MHTVIGAFDDAQTAQSARDRLIQAGVHRDDVHLEPDTGTASGSSGTAIAGASGTRQPGQQEGVLGSVGGFFANLFTSNNQHGHADTYSEAVRRGSTVLVVDADNEAEADRAADILR